MQRSSFLSMMDAPAWYDSYRPATYGAADNNKLINKKHGKDRQKL